MTGKLASSACAALGLMCFLGVLAWGEGSSGIYKEGCGRIDEFWNEVGHTIWWASAVNLAASLLVIGFYHKPRGAVGLAGSGLAFLITSMASTAMC